MAKLILKIKATNDITLHKGYIQELSTLSQSSSDPSKIDYGALANSGNAKILDLDNTIRTYIDDETISNSNLPIEIYLNNKKLQYHITTDSDYDNNEKTLDIQMTNSLNKWDEIPYQGRELSFDTSAYTLLSEVLSTLYTSSEIENMLSKSMIYGPNNIKGTVKSYLQNIIIPYAYLESDTFMNTIDKFCQLAQLQVFEDDNGNPIFVSARPIEHYDNLSNSLNVKNAYKITNLEKSIILKNKYDGINCSVKKVTDEIKYNTMLDSVTVTSFDDIETNVNNESKGQSKTYFSCYQNPSLEGNYCNETYASACYLKNKYCTASFSIDKKTNMSLYDIITIYNYINDGIRFVLQYKDKEKNGYKIITANSGTITDNNFTFTFSEEGFSESVKEGNLSNESSSSCDTSGVETSIELTLHNNATISFDSTTNKYTISYTFLVSEERFEGSKDKSIYYTDTMQSTSDIWISGTQYIRTPINMYISLYGDRREISLSDIDASTTSISSKKVVANLYDNELIQSNTKINNTDIITQIKDNIINDYKKGVSDGNVELFTGNIYNKSGTLAKNFDNGDILDVDDVIYFNNDLKVDNTQRYWRIKGREFTYSGQPKIKTYIQELSKIFYTMSFDTNGAGTIESINIAYGSSIGTLPTPTKSGYTFSGWTIDGVAITSSTIWNYTTDKTAVAQWDAIKYTVTFPSSARVTTNGTSISSGSSVVSGTSVTISFTGSSSNLIYLKLNDNSITSGSSNTITSNSTITVSYKQYENGYDYFTLPSSSSQSVTVSYNTSNLTITELTIRNRYYYGEKSEYPYYGVIEEDFTYPITSQQSVNYLRVWEDSSGNRQTAVEGIVYATNTQFIVQNISVMNNYPAKYEYRGYSIVEE